jgi:Stage II sporulation protein E (SpoIIE)./Y_Y_Y domain.
MKNILMLLAILLVTQLKANDNPFSVKNFNPAENNDNLSSDLYCISQTPNGTFIFGTKNGIYTFDGINTLYFPVAENNYVISCLAVSDNKIYVGLMNGFGYLTRNKFGKYDITILKREQTNKIYKIIHYKNHVVFCSKNKLSLYDDKDHFVKDIFPLGLDSKQNYFHNVFCISDTLYIREAGQGMLLYTNNKLIPMHNGTIFKDIGIFNIREHNGGMEFLSVDNGFYFYKNGYLQNISVPYMSNMKVRGAQTLRDGKLCVFTANDGVLILDSLYRKYAHISYHNGLKSGKINGIIRDFYGNIWTAGENGFHYISYGSPVISFNVASGLPGKIHYTNLLDSLFFVSSSVGLYYTSIHNMAIYNQINNIRCATWDLAVLNKQLLIASDNGLYKFHGNIVRKINNEASQYIYVTKRKNEFYCVGKNNISLYGNNFKQLYKLNFNDIPAKIINNCLFLEQSDTIRIYLSMYNSTSQNIESVLCYVFAKHRPVGTDTIQTQNLFGEVHFLNSDLLYSTVDSNYLIIHNKLIKSSENLNKYGPIQLFYKDSSISLIAIGNKIGRYDTYGNINFDDFNSISFQKIFSIKRLINNLYFSTDKGLYVYFVDRKINNKMPPKFTLSFIDKNNVYDLSDSVVSIKLTYQQNSFSILFVSTYFDNNNPAVFYWRILENSLEWTTNDHQNIASFFKVAPGNYTFEIKSKSIDGAESPIKKIHILILKPWYQTTFAYLIYGILLICIILLSVRIYVWRLRQQNILLENKVNERTHELILKNQEIERQKTEINIAHREITDSIYYAKRIQTAVLPPIDYIKKTVDNYFMFYKPRNVVSGDFYWINKVDDTTIFAAADCTGHGVPGAFMSLLGISMLNEIVLEKKITTPDLILNNLRERIINMLNPNGINDFGNVVLDGMDISICSYRKDSDYLMFAGANNKMFLVRQDTNEILEIEADSMPVGYYEIMKPFSLKQVEFKKGDMIILSSDGYKDQFGGPNGKKFMLKRFKELLSIICEKDTNPEEILEQTFQNWKGNGEQVDDVMVIGFSLSANAHSNSTT